MCPCRCNDLKLQQLDTILHMIVLVVIRHVIFCAFLAYITVNLCTTFALHMQLITN